MAKAINPNETLKPVDMGAVYGMYHPEDMVVLSEIDKVKSLGLPFEDRWVEVSQEYIDRYFPKGIGDQGYCIVKEVKLCLKGTKEKLANKPVENLEDRLHGNV